jgi:uncharacterized protein (UPF0303 family)
MKSNQDIKSIELLEQERALLLPQSGIENALAIGEIAKEFGIQLNLPIAVEVRISDWVIFHASLPGSSQDNQWWIDGKARVVSPKHHSTLYERVSAQERIVDWFDENDLSEDSFAIHGGGLPLITQTDGFVGALLISGLPQVEDHFLGVEVLTEFLARKGELL